MSTEVIGISPSAAVMDDQTDVEPVRLRGALPGVAEQPRLLVG